MKKSDSAVKAVTTRKFYIDRSSFCARTAAAFLVSAIIFRLIGSIGMYGDMMFIIFQVALPVVSCVLYLIFMECLGKKHLGATVLPVFLGTVFFILRAFTTDNIAGETLPPVVRIVSTALYVLVFLLYVLTVFNVIPTKWICVIIFAAPVVYYSAMKDFPALAGGVATVSSAFLEVSVLSMLLALFFACLGMRKLFIADPEKSKNIVPPIPGDKLDMPLPHPSAGEPEEDLPEPERHDAVLPDGESDEPEQTPAEQPPEPQPEFAPAPAPETAPEAPAGEPAPAEKPQENPGEPAPAADAESFSEKFSGFWHKMNDDSEPKENDK